MLTCVLITLVFAGGAFMRSAGPGATYFGEIDLPFDLYHLKILETVVCSCLVSLRFDLLFLRVRLCLF